MPLQVLAIFSMAVQDTTVQMEAGWESEMDLIFLQKYDIFRDDMGAVRLPTIRWSRGETGQPVYCIMDVSAVLGRVCILKDYARPGGFRLHTRMSR